MAITPIDFTQSNQATAMPVPQQSFLQKAGDFIGNVGKGAVSALSTAALRPVQAVTGAVGAITGNKGLQQASNEDMNVPTQFGNVNVPAQKTGMAGAEQIGGQAATDASYLIPGAEGEGVASGGFVKGAIQGAKIGATSGALGGAGNSMQQGGSAGQVLGSALSGGATGAVAGGTIGGASGLTGNIWAKAKGASSYDTNLANATANNTQAGSNAVNSVHEASGVLGDVQGGISENFSKAPTTIAQADPNAGTTLSADTLAKLNDLKETKAWSLPDSIKNATSLNGEIKLNPQQSQELISSLNDLKYNSKGDVVINQQASNLVNEVKSAAQAGMGHVIDAQGNSVWDRAYQEYRTGSIAREAISSVIPQKTNGILDPVEVNKSVNQMMKMMETPQGTASLIRANNEIKATTGYDVLNDPMGTINKLIESNKQLETAMKGDYMHQLTKVIKNPTMAGRRLVYLTSSLIGIAGLGTFFKKQIGSGISSMFSGQ